MAENAIFKGEVKPASVEPNFQIISGVDENAGGFTSCKRYDAWNGYYCNNPNLAILLFESLD